MTDVLQMPPDGVGLVVVASVSGGKDSTALILALIEMVEAGTLPLHLLRFVFADTGWEHADTYAYLDYLREKLGIVIDVVGVDGGMISRVRYRAGNPARKQRWCTRELKIQPLRAYHDEIEKTGAETISAMGVRADESKARAEMLEWEDDGPLYREKDPPRWGGYIWRPLIRWSVEDVLAMHNRHGVKVNPLYQRGHSRVGCYPCIMSNKEEIKLIAAESPERIDLIRNIEHEMTVLRAERNIEALAADGEERYAHALATFFQTRTARSKILRPCTLDHDHGDETDCDTLVIPAKPMTIDQVVAWSRTSRGGRQYSIFESAPTGGCMRWGLCDLPPGKDPGDEPGEYGMTHNTWAKAAQIVLDEEQKREGDK